MDGQAPPMHTLTCTASRCLLFEGKEGNMSKRLAVRQGTKIIGKTCVIGESLLFGTFFLKMVKITKKLG